MSRKRDPIKATPEDISRQAKYFYNLVSELHRKTDVYNLLDLDSFYNKGMYTIPIIVNATLACELYLKALLVKTTGVNEVPGEHNLQILFDLLEKAKQEKGEPPCGFDNREDFDTKLMQASTAFVDWRYLHEEREKDLVIDVAFLMEFLENLYLFAQMKIGTTMLKATINVTEA